MRGQIRNSPFDEFMTSFLIFLFNQFILLPVNPTSDYSQTSMARTSLGPWKFILDTDCSSDWGLIIAQHFKNLLPETKGPMALGLTTQHLEYWPNTTIQVKKNDNLGLTLAFLQKSHIFYTDSYRQNFKNLVWNQKDQAFDIWYVASSWNPLLRFFKLWS